MKITIENNEVKIKIGNDLRTIGELHGRVLRVKRKRQEHLMRKFNAYGFAKQLMEETFFDHLHIVEHTPIGTRNYLIDRNEIFTIGRYYQAPEFERQIFLDLPTLQNYVV